MHINISIIIPVYNPPHEMFERCIGSLMSQTGELGLEFIFVNDGSTDEWIAKRLERLEREDRRVHLQCVRGRRADEPSTVRRHVR